MTDKQTAALKLGLEAIEACLSAGTEAEDQDASDKLCDARAAIREALAEPQEKYTYGTPLLDAMMGKTEQPNIDKYLEKDNSEQPAQEPVAYAVYHRMGGSKSLHWPEQHSEDGDHNEYQLVPLYTSPPASKPWVGLVHEETHEAIGTAGVDLLELAKMWSDNKVHVYQFDNEARRVIEAVLRRASAKLREKNA